MRRKTFLVAVVLMLEPTVLPSGGALALGGHTATGGEGFAGHGHASVHGTVGHHATRRFGFHKRGLVVVPFGWGWSDFGYGTPGDSSGDDESTNSPPEPQRVVGCHRSIETVEVPSEDGGTRHIKMIRCP
jgi:hypothetical protein